MKPIVVTKELAAPGLKVVRGPDWCYYNQDGGPGSVGVIVTDAGATNGWVRVNWPNKSERYRVGDGGKYDLAVYNPFDANASEPFTPKARVEEIREAMSQSIKRADSLIEKSNTKHGNSNSGTNNRPNPIKVRRPISTIEGSKRRSRTPIKRGGSSARS